MSVEIDGIGTVPGKVHSVGTVVETHTDQSGTTTTLPVEIPLDGRDVVSYDESPETVLFTKSEVKGALAVPVRALLALAEGGYAVARVKNGGRELIAVQLGVTADGWVQITGEVQPGDSLEAAS